MEYDIIPERGSENAKKAIALAEKRGFDATEVRTFRDGYLVPLAPEGEKEEKPEPKPARKRTTKKE